MVNVLNCYIPSLSLTDCSIPPAEQMLASFETTASGKNKRTGTVFLRPLQAMQGWSLVDKQLDDAQSLLEGGCPNCFERRKSNNIENPTIHTE